MRLLNDNVKVVLWLNAAHGHLSYHRALAVKSRLDSICNLYRAIYVIRHNSKLPAAQRELGLRRPLREAKDRIADLNSFLSRYTIALQAKESLSLPSWVAMSLVPIGGLDEFFLELQSGDKTIRISEGIAVQLLLSLAEEGRLENLRLCERCQEKWMVSLRQMDRFCSSECRTKNRLNSDGNKERQRQNQKAYRERVKAKEARMSRATGSK